MNDIVFVDVYVTCAGHTLWLYCHLGGVIEVIETEDVTFYGVDDANADYPCKEPLEECREPLDTAHLGYLRTFCNSRESCNYVNADWVFISDCAHEVDRTDVEQVTYMCLTCESLSTSIQNILPAVSKHHWYIYAKFDFF